MGKTSLKYKQSDVSENLVYRHILKSIVKELKKKMQKLSYFKLESSMLIHMQTAAGYIA